LAALQRYPSAAFVVTDQAADCTTVAGYRAPKGKMSFIAALQPFLNAGEITFDPRARRLHGAACWQRIADVPVLERHRQKFLPPSFGPRFFLAEPTTTAATKDQWWRGMDEGVHRITMPHRPLRR
jgi:hypothetical protein